MIQDKKQSYEYRWPDLKTVEKEKYHGLATSVIAIGATIGAFLAGGLIGYAVTQGGEK